jgi:hypothetical protein
MLHHVVQISQSTCTTTGCDLIDELEGIKVSAEPGMNIAKCQQTRT